MGFIGVKLRRSWVDSLLKRGREAVRGFVEPYLDTDEGGGLVVRSKR
jgi:hypothetical protein